MAPTRCEYHLGMSAAGSALRRDLQDVAKRLFDIVAAALTLVVLSPVLAVLTLLVWWRLGRPILHIEMRPGLDAALFRIYKFRTMRNDRDLNGTLLPDEARLTRFGRFLRAASLDEFPEFWNVLRGDMSIVGPRPLLEKYIPLYSVAQARRHEVRPGITGLAQVSGRNNLDWQRRLELDVWYVDNRSLWLDVKILAKTIRQVLARDGISQEGHATKEPFLGTAPRDGGSI